MNERIDELAFEAGCHRHKFWDPKHPALEGFIISQAVLDKFAEMIVEVCLNKIENEAAQYAEPVWAVELVNDIKEHFGVSE